MSQILQSVQALVQTLVGTVWAALYLLWVWLEQPSWNPLDWNGPTLSLVGFAVLIFALLMRQRVRYVPKTSPDLLISKGEIVQLENSILQQLRFKISNLGELPVQLLELSLRTNLSNQPLMIEAVELLPPQEVVELEATLPAELIGDSGVLNAYAYVAGRGKRIYTLRAILDWEPWDKRFKISPVGQTIRPARKLVSAHLKSLHKQVWLEQNPHLDKVIPPPPQDLLVTESRERQAAFGADFEADTRAKRQPARQVKQNPPKPKLRRKTPDLDFPTKF